MVGIVLGKGVVVDQDIEAGDFNPTQHTEREVKLSLTSTSAVVC